MSFKKEWERKWRELSIFANSGSFKRDYLNGTNGDTDDLKLFHLSLLMGWEFEGEIRSVMER